MTTSKKATSKKKSTVKKKSAPGKGRVRTTGKSKTITKSHKRNKNNLTDDEQAFADAIMTNRDGSSATDIAARLNPKIKRMSCRNKASEWLKDARIKAYMDSMRQRVEDKVEYDLVKWRQDLIDVIDMAMGRKSFKQVISVLDETGAITEQKSTQYTGHSSKDAKAALELIAKQMKLLTEKNELGMTEQLMELFGKVKPTTGPPSIR